MTDTHDLIQDLTDKILELLEQGRLKGKFPLEQRDIIARLIGDIVPGLEELEREAYARGHDEGYDEADYKYSYILRQIHKLVIDEL